MTSWSLVFRFAFPSCGIDVDTAVVEIDLDGGTRGKVGEDPRLYGGEYPITQSLVVAGTPRSVEADARHRDVLADLQRVAIGGAVDRNW